MPDKLLNLKQDIVFQELFGKSKNSSITSNFLSLILRKNISDIDLDVNKRMLGNRPDSKTGRLDIRAKFNNGEDANIELQVLPYPHMPERMLHYWGNMYQNKIDSGNAYNVLNPSYSILIADYKLQNLEHIDKYHTIWNLREEDIKFHDTIITKNIELHILEIPKIKGDEILTDQLAQWLKFIESPENKEVEKFMCSNKYLKQAKEELAYLSGDEGFQRLVEARAGFLMDQDVMKRYQYSAGLAEGESKGLAKGKTEGKKQNQIEIAKKMKRKNMPIEDIIELTGLSEEEIENL